MAPESKGDWTRKNAWDANHGGATDGSWSEWSKVGFDLISNSCPETMWEAYPTARHKHQSLIGIGLVFVHSLESALSG